MSDIAMLIADMVKAGVDPDLIGRTAAALADRTPIRVPDEQAERRRAADRARKRLRKSAETAEEVSPQKETSPAPPKEKTTPSRSEADASSPKRAARLRADWVLPGDWRADALALGMPAERIAAEAERMLDWSLSSPNGAKLDWRATWRNWVRQAAEKTPRPRGGAGSRPAPRGADHFDQFAEGLRHGSGTDGRGGQGYRDDAAGLPVLTIEHHR